MASYTFFVLDNGRQKPGPTFDPNQGNEWYKSINYKVEYVKSTTGAPTGTPSTGEKCLNTADATLYQESSGSWDAGIAVTSGQRFIHKDSGTDTTGNSGTYTKSDKIYDYNGSTFDETIPTTGASVMIDELGTGGEEWKYDGSDWVKKVSTVDHNELSNLQGGGTGERYHITANQEAGLNAATSITSSNPPQTLADRDKMPVPYRFVYRGGFAAGQTDVEIYGVDGALNQILLPSSGSIVKMTLQSSSARTAGTFTAEPAINGTKVTVNDLDCVLDATTTNDDRAEVAPGTTGLTFSAGDKISVMCTSDGSWDPTNSDIVVIIYVIFNS